MTEIETVIDWLLRIHPPPFEGVFASRLVGAFRRLLTERFGPAAGSVLDKPVDSVHPSQRMIAHQMWEVMLGERSGDDVHAPEDLAPWN